MSSMFHIGHAASLELSSLWNVPQTHVVMVVAPIYHIELHKCTNLHARGKGVHGPNIYKDNKP